MAEKRSIISTKIRNSLIDRLKKAKEKQQIAERKTQIENKRYPDMEVGGLYAPEVDKENSLSGYTVSLRELASVSKDWQDK